MGDAAFKKVASMVGVASTKLRRRLPLDSKKLTNIAPSSNILGGINVAVVAVNDSLFRNDLISNVVTQSGGKALGDSDATSTAALDAVVCDTTGITKLENLQLLHTKLHPLMGKLSRNGRLVMVGADFAADSAHAAGGGQVSPIAGAVNGAVKGFTKSMAKEIGGRGSTANMVHLAHSYAGGSGNGAAESVLPGTLQWLLSPRSAYVTGQELRMQHHTAAPAAASTGVDSVASAFDVTGRRVLVTGAARGIGEYTARLFAMQGARVLLLDHPSMADRLAALAKELGGHSVTLDVTSDDAPAAVMLGVKAAFGVAELDVVVHNAGITRDKTFKNMTHANFAAVVDVNLAAVGRLDQVLLFSGVLQPGGRVTYLSSIAGIAGNFGQTNYGCSKGGVVGYVAALGAAMAARGIGINAVAPGFIETEMTSKIPYITRNVARFANDLKQEGYPTDIAEALLFLSSQASIGLNGITLRVCGGNIVGA